MTNAWPVVLVLFLLVQLTLYIGVPVVVLLLVLRHHRRKTVELWLQTVERGAVPPPPASPAAPRAWARTWTALGYPRR